MAFKSFESKVNLLKGWGNFIPETLLQRFNRLILGTHKKTSRLCTLGELGTYLMLVKRLTHTLNYKWSLFNKQDKNSLVYEALNEMSVMSDNGIDCWLSRVNKMEVLLNLSSPNVDNSI